MVGMDQAQREALARDLWAFFITGDPQAQYLDGRVPDPESDGDVNVPVWATVLPLLEQHLGPVPDVVIDAVWCPRCKCHHVQGDHA